ncbi:MAG: hypothetical protein ACJ8CR_33870, partial [Roseiflexaceae bacterium]
MPILMVPIHLDALLLEQDRAVVDAMVDFTQLPFFDGTRDVNSDTANLSEAIISSPFANQNLRLPAGVHLHWALPDALTRGRQTSDGQAFPPVPNRWLVVRSRGEGKDAFEQAWVVESDYLHPDGAGAETGSVAYPVDPSPDRGAYRPYRYLGRVVPLKDWKAQDPTAERLGHLTAVGYGEPTFAAFYPNCRNVFGLHDGDYTAPQAGLRYDVVGWYSDSEQDYLQTVIRESVGADPVEAIKQAAMWTAAVEKGQTFPNRMLCYARLTFAPADDGARSAAGSPAITIAVGNTGPQALSAYLADAIGGEQRAAIEEQLEAMLLAPRLDQRRLDLDAKFREARHEAGFVAFPAGSLWTLRRETTASAPADAAQASRQAASANHPPPELEPALDALNHALNTLNLRQQAYDRAIDEIASLSRQLFADWYRYMLCAYPPEGSGEDYPDIDEVKHYIERKLLPRLKARVKEAGLLVLRQDSAGASYPAAADDNRDSLATAVAQAAAEVRARLATINASKTFTDASMAYRLRQTEAPRYWQPAEPVVLMAGEAIAPAVRHGQDGRLRADGLLDCQIVARAPLPPENVDDAAVLVSIIDRLAPEAGVERIGFQTWERQDWHALLLSWQVEVLPTAGRGDRDVQGGAYGPGFIVDNYALADDEPELRLQGGKSTLSQAANVYSGTSILTPYAQAFHSRRIAAYIMGIYRAELQLPALLEEEAEAYLKDSRNYEKIRAWQESKQRAPGDTPDPVGTALRAFQHLQATPSMSQSLGGFNEALLTRKQTLQLDIADPLGFDDYRPFTDTVRKYVQGNKPGAPPPADDETLPPYLQGHNRSAPQPANDFNPIRSGALELLRLRLLDAFGRAQDLEWSRIIATQQMPVSKSGDLIALPPRLVQPARLNFRWLSADIADQQTSERASETPICGWVVPNHLDESLAFYRAMGKALGSIDRAGQWQFAPGAPAITPEEIVDTHLKKLIVYLLGRGATFLQHLHGALDSALENIDPENFAQHQEMALLMGRPLALVRASLSLELQGLPAVHQGWNQFRQDIRRDTRDTDGFTGVLVPIRVGDYRQLNDGLAGYWKETDDSYEDTFYAPLSEPIDDPSIQTHASGELAILQSLDSRAQVLSMLIDPRGAVHATCGVLPVKTIDIPPDQYTDALRRIEVTFVSGPILGQPRQLGLPLPAEPGYDWSWIERDGAGWRETWTFPTIERQAFQEGLALLLWDRLTDRAVGWLRPLADRPGEIGVVPLEERAAPLGPELAGIAGTIQQILEQNQAPDTTIAKAAFLTAAGAAIGQPAWEQLRDASIGWLKEGAENSDRARVAI